MKPEVSIIMPVYNSAKYLETAVRSVLEQSFQNIELLLIDDGSKDESPALCDRFAKEDSRVVVIHKPNGGICSARNAGLEAAQGDYIGFCDNDDRYKPGLIEDNYLKAKENQLDLMRYSKEKVIVREDGKSRVIPSHIEDMIITRDQFAEHFQNVRREDTVWSALYRREIIDIHHIRFDESIRYGGEDACFNLQFLTYAEKIGFSSKAYYQWMQRDGHSTSRAFHPEFLLDYRKCMKMEYAFIHDICKDKVPKADKLIFLNNAYLYLLVSYMFTPECRYSLKEQAEYFRKIRQESLFCDTLDDKTAQEIKKKSKRIYLSCALFYRNHFRLYVWVLRTGEKILSKLRYK